MRIVVIGGQARKVGKTSVMAGLIRGLKQLRWAAVKISRHDGRIPHLGRPASSGAAGDRGFILTEETAPSRATDTGRYLSAGAKRALWLRVESGRMSEAVAALTEALAGEENVMIESTSALNILKRDVGVAVVDRSRREIKPDFSRSVNHADAIVEVESGGEAVHELRQLTPGVRRFTVTRKGYFSSRLCRFVSWKLRCKAV